MTVLLRVRDEENFIWPGYHDGEVWCWVDGSVVSANVPVLGWMELEDAAKLLDNAGRDASVPCGRDLGVTTQSEREYLWYGWGVDGDKSYKPRW